MRTNEEYTKELHKMEMHYRRQLDKHNEEYEKTNRFIALLLGIGILSCVGALIWLICLL